MLKTVSTTDTPTVKKKWVEDFRTEANVYHGKVFTENNPECQFYMVAPTVLADTLVVNVKSAFTWCFFMTLMGLF